MPFDSRGDWREDDGRRPLAGWLLGLAALGLVVGVAALIYWRFTANGQPAASLDRVMAIESRLTLEADDGRHLTGIDRQTSPEVWFRVTLNHAPVGEQLALDCDWIDPNGQVVRQNHYRTRVIDKEIWPTHARCKFGPESAVGKWTVRLLLAGRLLGSAELDVRDGGEGAERPPIVEKVEDEGGGA